MKPISFRATILALLTITMAGASPGHAQDQTTAPPTASTDSGLPPGIATGSQTAEVLKLAQAGLDPSVISAYVANAPSAFNLNADQIITLKDAGVPSDTINAMMDHDKSIMGTTTTAPAPSPAPMAPQPAVDNTMPPPPDNSAPAPDPSTMPPPPDGSQDVPTDNGPDTAPPPPVSIDYFNQNLQGYGSWVMVPGYGRCWRPTAVLYDTNWHPYCDHGHWVYTDCGWYWQSDYAWGATFHYGRWFQDGSFGWCWYPDYVWSPSWVVWRSSDDYCGWAPLPPFAVYQPGVGFLYRGAAVSVDFDFGLGANIFIFVDHDHFTDHHPRQFRLDAARGATAFHQTTIINHFDVRNRVVVNAGFPVDRVRPRSGPAIKPVAIGSMTDARREGWRGQVTVPQHTGPGNPAHNPSGTVQPRNFPANNGNNGSHTFNNNGQGVSHPNNNPAVNNNGYNNQGNRLGNPAINNNPQNNQNYHVTSQSPTGGNSTAHYSSPSTPNNNANSGNNNNHSQPPQKVLTPGSITPGAGAVNGRSQAQYQTPQNQTPQNNYQTRFNNNGNNNNSTPPEHNYAQPYSQPRTESVPQSPQPPQHSGAPAYPAHNGNQMTSGSSSSGQSHNSGNNNNNNNQQQGH